MPTGLTKDAGWQLGVRRTVPHPVGQVWGHLLGDGLRSWLGDATLGSPGQDYETPQGARGQVRSRTELRRIRLTWQPSHWPHDSTLQVTVVPAATGTTVAFHQERLHSAQEREEMLDHWREVLDRITRELGSG